MVGVGNDEEIKKDCYDFYNYASFGHGQYMLSYNNFTYHHSDETFNL